MKIKCTKNHLIDAVLSVQRAVSNKSILSVLEGILITVDNNKIILRGNDLETAIEYTIDGEIIEEGTVVLNSKIFGEIVRKLPESDITITSNEEFKVTIDCSNSHFEIKGLNPEGFPEIPTVDLNNGISINQETLKNMIKQVIFSVSIDDKMPVLTGVYIETHEDQLNMVAIDGFRMSFRKENILGTSAGMKIVVPGKALNEVSRLLKNDSDTVSIFYEKNQILFDLGNCKFVSKLLQGEYINYKSIYPESYETSIIVNTSDIAESIDRASLIIYEDTKSPVSIEIKENTLNISSKTEIGNVHETVSIAKEGNDIAIAFNPKYLLDVFKNIVDDKIKISFSDSIGQCVIEPINDDLYSYIVLPIRTD